MASEVSSVIPSELDNPYLVVVAIDFGTTYSGYAFSFLTGKEKDEIFMNRDWRNEQNCKTHKTPTCLLLGPDLSFDSFGYDALENYAELQGNRKEKEYFFFQHFKMELHNNQDLNLETRIYAANGKPVKALKVFKESLKFMKEEALMVISSATGEECKVEEIRWVVTVPAIWTPAAKQFMRVAAYEAGVGCINNPNQLIIALEPEAAAIFCMEKKLSQLEYERGKMVKDVEFSQPNTEYVVVDIGGGTLDVAVHRIAENGTIQEIDKITGGPHGGIKVNQKFIQLLNDLAGEENMRDYAQKNPSDWLVLMNDFEGKKQGYRVLDNKMTNVRLPYSAQAWTKKVKNSALKRYGKNEIRFRTCEFIVLSSNVMKMLFKPVLDSIKSHLKTVLKRPQLSNVRTMLLVGGFGDCVLLQEELRKEFSEYRVLAPRDAATSILKGAVMFGKNPAKITKRVVSTTYGADCSRPFKKEIHLEEYRFLADGHEMCRNVFCCFVKENENARLGESVKKMYNPLFANDTVLTFGFYIADNPETMYVTEKGVRRVGTVTVESPDTSQGLNRDIEVTMHFGGTEILATAVDTTSGNRAQTSLDFFHK